MLRTLAFRHALARKRRSSFLLLGFGLGVGVMITLLAVGEAMLDQARDRALVGGGELTLLPAGVDVEALRTGGVSGMFFGIDRARFVARQQVGGPRLAGAVAAVAPVLEDKLLYLHVGGRRVPVRAGGEIPSAMEATGAALDVRTGTWTDTEADRAWVAPTPEQLYHQLDRFHLPATPDSTWAEWHYFNLVTGPEEWWYVTLMVAGAMPDGEWGGLVLVTHRRRDGRHVQRELRVPAEAVVFDTLAADLVVGRATVVQREGRYEVNLGDAGPIRGRFTLVPAPHRWFPPLELGGEGFTSGYVVPAVDGRAAGRLCLAEACARFEDAPAYHDHNWGTWRDVTWEWGMGRGTALSLLYGGVRGPEAGSAPFFLAVLDSLGLRQVQRFDLVRTAGRRAATGAPGALAPDTLELVGRHGADRTVLTVAVLDAHATRQAQATGERDFLQMRGRWRLTGSVAGAAVADSGTGFFETWRPAPPAR